MKKLRALFVKIVLVSLVAQLIPTGMFGTAFAANANGAPVFVSEGGKYIVPLNSPAGTVVGELSAIDPESDHVSYALLSGEGIAVSSTGQITLTQAATNESGALRNFTVTGNDGTNTVIANFQMLITPNGKLAKTGASVENFYPVYGDNVVEFVNNSNNLETPSSKYTADKIDFSSESFDHTGIRYRAYLKPDTTGVYKFFISGDDDAELYLGSSADPATKKKIAYTNGGVAYRVWNKNASQQSAEIRLVKGQIYYIETLFKDEWWSENLSVAWQVPGGAAPVNYKGDNVISSKNLYQIDSFDWTAPSTPRAFNVEKVDANGVLLKWYESTDTSGISEYRMSIDNGQQIIKFNHVLKENVPVYSYVHSVTSGVHTYSLVGVDNDGNISIPTKTVTVDASKSYDAIETAMIDGNSTLLTDPTPIIDKAFNEMTSMSTKTTTLLNQFYRGVSEIEYKPDAYAKDLLKPSEMASEHMFTILNSNVNGTNPLAVAGWTSNDLGNNRVAAFGDSPFKFTKFISVLKNTIQWLVNGDSGVSISNAATTKIGISSNDNVAMKSWLKSNLGLNDANIVVCSSAADVSCFQDPSLDLMMISPRQDVVNPAALDALQAVIDAKIPVMYTKDIATFEPRAMDLELMKKLGFTFAGTNYWSNSSASYNSSNIESMKVQLKQTKFEDLRVALTHLKNGDWQDTATNKMDACKESFCPDDVAKNYLKQNFYLGVNDYLKANLSYLDSNATLIFKADEVNANRLFKLMILLGDVYRQEIKCKIDYRTSVKDRNRWFRAYFADNTVYNTRMINPQQPDLGTFSKQIDVQSLKEQGKVYQDKHVVLKTKKDGYFSATGYYALPGETFTITRKDNGTGTLSVAINSIRSGSTKEFDGYTRPKNLMSQWIKLTKDVPVKITNPYGGPIQISVGSTNLEEITEVKIDNIGKHATWNSTATSGEFTSSEFAKLLAEGDYNWAEFITPGFQLHSTREHMLNTLKDQSWNTPEKLADATMENLYKAMYNLAGFSGEGLSLDDSVSNYCKSKGWGTDCLSDSTSNIHKINALTHAISDQATCGFGCSGNPYDYYWSYSVIGWGEAHEIGHNIQSFHITDKNNNSRTGEVTNNIFAIYTMYKWNKMHPDEYRLTHRYEQDKLFKMLNYAQTQANPKEFVYQQLWEEKWRTDLFGDANVGLYKLSFYHQLIQQNKESFGQDGWDLITALYMHERLVNQAKSSESVWNSKRNSLGYSNYSWLEAKSLTANDNLLIATSFVTGKDQRNHFDLYGVYYSDKAANQVAALPDVEKKFYYFSYLPLDTNDTGWTGVSLGSVTINGNVNATLPKTPINLIFPKVDEKDENYYNTTQFVTNKVVELSSVHGTAGKVTFKVKSSTGGSSTVIPGCKDIATSLRKEGPASRFVGEYVVNEQEAVCSWVPDQSGDYEVVAEMTPTDNTYTNSTSKKLLLNVIPASSAPTITNLSSLSPAIGEKLTISGSNLEQTANVTLNGVIANIESKSASSVVITVPSVLYSQSVGQLVLTSIDGFKVSSPEISLNLPGMYFESTTLNLAPLQKATPAVLINREKITSGVTWSTSDASIANVNSSTGLVTALKEGTAIITATLGNNQTAISVTVNAVPLTAISVDKSLLNLNAGGTSKLNASYSPLNASNQDVIWTSSNPGVATVSVDGVVTAISNGNAIISVKSVEGGFTARTVVTVTDVMVSSVVLSSKLVTLKPNDTTTLAATVFPLNALNKSVTWSSSNTSIATVSTAGVVTAKSDGIAVVTVRTSDGSFTANATIQVASVKLNKITLNTSKLDLQPNKSSQLTPTLTAGATANLTWTSSNTKVATVSSSGLVTAIANGNATITVVSENGIKAKATVKVKAIKPKEVVVNESIPVNVTNGMKIKLTAKLVFSDNSTIAAAPADVKWSSLNTKAATVDENGLVTVVDATKTIKILVTPKYGGKSCKVKN